MTRLAVRLMGGRIGTHAVSALVIAAGTALLTGFAGLLAAGIDSGPDGTTLRLLPIILGSWTAAIVAFAVGSAMSLVLAQREREFALVRSIGAEPTHVRRLVLGQTLATAVPAVVVGLLPGVWLGQLVLDRLVGSGAAPAGARVPAGLITLGGGASVTFAAAVVAALVVGRAMTRISPVRALAAVHEAPAAVGLGRARKVTALVFIAAGLGSGFTALAFDNAKPAGQVASAGPACVLAGVGLALLAPAFAPAWGRLVAFGDAGRFAGRNLGSRIASASAPIVVLVAVATGTLTMQSVENAAHTDVAANSTVDDGGASTVAAANTLVVIMVVAFTVLAVVTTLVAVNRGRRREFALLRVIAATPRQVRRVVVLEAVLTAALGIALGTLGALATIVPYSLAKLGTPLPFGTPVTYVVIVAGSLAVAVGAAVTSANSAMRGSAVEALAS